MVATKFNSHLKLRRISHERRFIMGSPRAERQIHDYIGPRTCNFNTHARICCVCCSEKMNYPQDARKDRFEFDPDFCYDCCAPKDECVCDPMADEPEEHW